MKAFRLATAAILLPALGGCLATKQDLETLRTQIDADRAADRAAQQRQIDQLVARTQALLDSLSSQGARMRADMANRMLQLDRQLTQVAALSGQSQQQIRDLQRHLEQRAAESRDAQDPATVPVTTSDSTVVLTPTRPARPPADTARTATRPPAPRPQSPTRPRPASDGAPTADEAYEAALGAYRRGSLATAREGFQEFLRIAPDDARAPDAQFYVGESYSRDPDAAIAAYQRVVDRWPESPRAPAALLRMARLEIARGDRTQARAHLNRILRSYPRSDEADEARTQLDRLGAR
jgi:tol-pal system protein YbgF